ncbi:MAG: DUF1080 domain-containing protein [Verrucomicrobiaceae bacterium]|nr:DUF1080 domain-containing protein [Verrucomicrobiaceae bacterium]
MATNASNQRLATDSFKLGFLGGFQVMTLTYRLASGLQLASFRSMKTSLFLLLAACLVSVTSVADPASATAPVVLFDGKSLDKWEPVDIGGSGSVEVQDGEMIISQGESVSGAIYKDWQKLPTTNYEISLEAMRVQGVDFFVGLTFPVNDLKTQLTLVMGGWGGSVTGISSIDGLDASENNTGTFQRYKDNTWYKVKLRVTPKEIVVTLDGKEVINTDIAGKKLGLRPGPMESYAGLSLTTFMTTAAIKNVVLTPLPAKS